MGTVGRRKEGAHVAFNFLFKESSVLFNTKKRDLYLSKTALLCS